MAFDPGVQAAQQAHRQAVADQHRRFSDNMMYDARRRGRRRERRPRSRLLRFVFALVKLGLVAAALVWAAKHPDTVQQWVDQTWAFIDEHR